MRKPRQAHFIARTAGLALVLALVAAPVANAAATQTKTLLTGGEVRYQGSATADYTYADSEETNEDHARGTFDESFLVSPYQTAATYRNSLAWSDASASEHTRLTNNGEVEDDFTCAYGYTHAGGNGTFDVNRTTHVVTVRGMSGALVDSPNADCTDHGVHQGDLRTPAIALMQGTQTTLALDATPKEADSVTLPVSQTGTTGSGYQTAANGTITLTCALCVTAIDFRQPDIPSGDMEDVPDTGTYDGNQIEIDVTVENRSTVALTVPATLQLRDGPTLASDQITAAPGSTTKLIYTKIDTTGWAWKDGTAETTRAIDFITPFGGGTRDLPIRPKPLILVHGLNSSAATWAGYQSFASARHPNWDTFAVGDGQVPGTMDTDGNNGRSIADNALTEAQYIAAVRAKTDASHVDLVVHSMGGLISRQYIQTSMPDSYDGKPVVSHLVMLGTPNMGSPCADLASALPGAGTPYRELRPDWVVGVFDKAVTNQRGVAFSVVAGNPLSFTCLNDDDPGDGVVEIPSAWYQYLDHATTGLLHTSMTGSAILFDSFVVPHLVPAAGSGTGAAALRPLTAPQVAAGDVPSTGPQVVARGTIALAPSGDGTLAVPVSAGDAAVEAVLAAPASVAAELDDPSGHAVVVQDANSDDAGEPIRTLRANSPVAGSWTLKLHQAGSAPVTVPVEGAVTGDPLALAVSATQPAGGGPVSVVAQLTDAGTGVTGATVSAAVTGDDGSHTTVPLAEAGGGRYTGASGALGAGYHLAVVTASTGAGTRIATASALPQADTDGGGAAPPTTSPPTTSPPTTSPPTTSPPTTTAPVLALTAGGRARQSLRRGVLLVTCASHTAGRCSAVATVKLGHARLRAKATAAITPGRAVTLRLRLAKSTVRKLRRALARHRALKASVAVTLRDAAGRTADRTLTIRLTR
jgi:pimeloyl-ACP methyl ester carboxylesterase